MYRVTLCLYTKMERTDTLLLNSSEVASLLTIDDCMTAVEHAFGLHAEGKAAPPKVIGIHSNDGGVHIKAGILELQRPYFVTKINANFAANPKLYGLPTIQGVVVVCDGTDGRLLCLMDSIAITIIRTGAATAIAAKYLARADASVATICGCGNQGKISLKALLKVRQLKKVYAFDIDTTQTEKFRQQFSQQVEIIPVSATELTSALSNSQICITCTTAKQPFIGIDDIQPGTFIAAVGADSEEKQELFPELVANSKIIADIAQQSATIGDLHHAIKNGLITIDNIHAELGQIIAGIKPGRESDKEIIIFDSTGTALQDVAAAAIVYEKALSAGVGVTLNFSN